MDAQQLKSICSQPDFESTTTRAERVQVNSANSCLNPYKQIFRGLDFSTHIIFQITLLGFVVSLHVVWQSWSWHHWIDCSHKRFLTFLTKLNKFKQQLSLLSKIYTGLLLLFDFGVAVKRSAASSQSCK